MQEQKPHLKKLRLLIIALNIIGLLCFFPLIVTTFAYGVGDMTLVYLLLYPLFFVALILILNKVRLGYFISLLIIVTYCILLASEVGRYFVFNITNYALMGVMIIPYLIFLVLIALTTRYLSSNLSITRNLTVISIIVALGFLLIPIADRYDKNYSDHIFVDVEIDKSGQATLNCKPGFADSRIFVVTTDNKEVIDQIKRYGEYFQGSYFLHNTVVQTKFRFTELKSVTLKKIGKKNITPELTWMIKEIKGEVDFLEPHY